MARLQPSGDLRSIEQAVMTNITSSEIRELLGRLPVEQRTPIALAYFDGHSYREVARVLGQPEGTVKSRIRAGLENLKGILTVVGIDPV